MTLAEVIRLALLASIVLLVFSLGLQAPPGSAVRLIRRPGLLARSLLAMYVLVPLFAIGLALAFDLPFPVKVALVALAVSPVPPFLPKKQLKAGGSGSYAFGLLVVAGVLAIVFVPLALHLGSSVFERAADISPAAIARIVALTIVVPLGLGMLVAHLAPRVADRIAKPAGLIATVLLVAAFLPVLVTMWRPMMSLIGDGTLAAFVAFAVAALIAGDVLGGPRQDDRVVLALSSAARHPGVAMAIASANAADEKLVPAAVLLYLVVNGIVSVLYLKWRARGTAAVALPTQA